MSTETKTESPTPRRSPGWALHVLLSWPELERAQQVLTEQMPGANLTHLMRALLSYGLQQLERGEPLDLTPYLPEKARKRVERLRTVLDSTPTL
jgi:hypothetical protein